MPSSRFGTKNQVPDTIKIPAARYPFRGIRYLAAVIWYPVSTKCRSFKA
jgi:hypothetical protein